MPFLPNVYENQQTRVTTSVFLGYNHKLKPGEGNNTNGLEFRDMQNLTSDYFPLMANRRKRGSVSVLTNPGGMIAKEALAYVSNQKLYYNGYEIEGFTLTSGEKQLISMGAYLIIWPDRKYLNTKDLSDFGSMDASFTTSGDVTYNICDVDANDITNVATTQPDEPIAGQYWLDDTEIPHTLKVFNGATASWVTVPTVYTKITSANIGAGFSRYDGVNLSGIVYSGTDTDISAQYDTLNGSKVIFACSTNYIVVIGLIDAGSTQSTGSVSVSRTAPDMDYITEAGNRLWGCKYGLVDGQTVNEIYCCALGDFKNWHKYEGVSTDSYAASVGTDGPWTGAITHLGYPLFFKENVMHKVYASATGAHQIIDTACRGVQAGCWKSLAIVGERLYYKARAGVMMYDGSLPENVSDVLGEEQYSNASAGSINEKYYISMQDASNKWHMFVLDTAKGLWHREDNTHALCFSHSGNELYYIDAESDMLIAENGRNGSTEGKVHWRGDTGIIGYTTVEQKYISRFSIRMELPAGSDADLYIQYDSDGVWHHCGHMNGTGTGSFMIPVRPRRCDHFQMRIAGEGEVRVYSVSKIFEAGSDVV